MKIKKIIFIKYSLLEELEATNKGNLDSNQILTLINKKKYQLEEAVIFKEKLEGSPLKNLVNEIITINDIETLGYDLYMDTVIVEETVYKVEEGFKGTLITEKKPKVIEVNHDTIKIVPNAPKISGSEFSNEEKTSEQLLADFMLGI